MGANGTMAEIDFVLYCQRFYRLLELRYVAQVVSSLVVSIGADVFHIIDRNDTHIFTLFVLAVTTLVNGHERFATINCIYNFVSRPFGNVAERVALIFTGFDFYDVSVLGVVPDRRNTIIRLFRHFSPPESKLMLLVLRWVRVLAIAFPALDPTI